MLQWIFIRCFKSFLQQGGVWSCPISGRRNQAPLPNLWWLLSGPHIGGGGCGCVAQLCLTLCNPVDYSPPGSSVQGILQAGILEWAAILFSRASFPPRDQTRVSYVFCISGRFFTIWATREALTQVGPSLRNKQSTPASLEWKCHAWQSPHHSWVMGAGKAALGWPLALQRSHTDCRCPSDSSPPISAPRQAEVTLVYSILNISSWKCFYIRSTHSTLICWVGAFHAKAVIHPNERSMCCPACELMGWAVFT